MFHQDAYFEELANGCARRIMAKGTLFPTARNASDLEVVEMALEARKLVSRLLVEFRTAFASDQRVHFKKQALDCTVYALGLTFKSLGVIHPGFSVTRHRNSQTWIRVLSIAYVYICLHFGWVIMLHVLPARDDKPKTYLFFPFSSTEDVPQDTPITDFWGISFGKAQQKHHDELRKCRLTPFL